VLVDHVRADLERDVAVPLVGRRQQLGAGFRVAVADRRGDMVQIPVATIADHEERNFDVAALHLNALIIVHVAAENHVRHAARFSNGVLQFLRHVQ
jgi:hypothetical protein